MSDKIKYVGYSNLTKKDFNIPDFEKGDSFATWSKRLGAKSEAVTGKIGSGTKVHRLIITYIDRESTSMAYGQGYKARIVLEALSFCGSQRWRFGGGYSPLRVLGSVEDHKITCIKCDR